MKKIIYVLLPLQVLILLLSPRFGWKIHNPESIVLSYKGITYVDGKFHDLYKSDDEKIDICYESFFSKQFFIIINDTDEYEMKVYIDGETEAAVVRRGCCIPVMTLYGMTPAVYSGGDTF